MLNNMKKKLFLLFLIPGIFCIHRSIQDARNEREELIAKYMKTSKIEEGAIRLIGGETKSEGNVEIFHKGRWGGICDDEWDASEANVVCRQLGYSTNLTNFTHSSKFGPAKRLYWMDNIMCEGNENKLKNCRFDGWGNNDCESTEAAGVICNNSSSKLIQIRKPIINVNKNRINKKMDIRLTGGRERNEGKVEVRFNNGIWGTVCGDGWSLLEANIICQQLNYGYANNAFQTDYFFDNSTTKNIILSGSECFGNETKFSDCLHHTYQNEIYCHGNKDHVAAVICTKNLPDLVVDHFEIERTAHLEDKPMFFLQCAMEENCVATEAYAIQREDPAWHLQTRRLLKFTAKVLNAGTADFKPNIPKHLWEWHMCHMHYHSMEVFANFDVYNIYGEKVAEGHKASFCLEDNECINGAEAVYSCANYGDQGISVNCSDIYRYNIDCQWIDISEIDYGDYILKISVNPDFKVAELSYNNNAAQCNLLYTESYARVYNCKLTRP